MSTIKVERVNKNISVKRVERSVKVERKKKTYAVNAGGKRGLKGDKGDKGDPGEDGVVQSIVAGENVSVNNEDPANPVINATAEPQEYTEFVFNSSGEQGGNRFNNWTDLFAAMPEDRIKVIVQFEQDEVWDEPGEYDMTRVSLSGNGNLFVSGAAIELFVQDGVTFSSVDGFTITNGMFFHSQSHEPLAIIESGEPTVRANYLAAFVTDYCEIFRTRIAGSLNISLVPGGAFANISAFTGYGYEIVNLESSTGEGFQVRFGGFGSGIMNNTVRGTDNQFLIIKEDIGYLETDTVGIPGLGNLDSTHENYTGNDGEPGRLTLVKASQIDISAIEGLVATQVQAALEELAERPIGIPDVPYEQMDISSKIFNFLAGEYLDLGTDGFANLRWRRVGRQLEGYFGAHFGSDATLGSFTLLGTDMPFMPRTPLGAEVGMFCYVAVQESSPGAGDGVLLPLGSVTSDVGLGFPVLFLVQLSGDPGDGGLSNIFLMNGQPIDLTGREFNIYGRIVYECAEAQGNVLYINGDFEESAQENVLYSSTVPIVISSEDQLPITAEFGLGTPPPGLSLNIDGTDLTISGTPTNSGPYIFQIKLTDSNGLEYIKAVSIAVAEPSFDLSFAGGSYPGANENIPYSNFLVASYEDSSQLPITAGLVSGTLPPGLSLSVQDDYKVRLSGTPSSEGTFNFRIKVTDQFLTEAEGDASLLVNPYNPELDPLYLGTVSGNSLNINFNETWQAFYGVFSVNIHTFTDTMAIQANQILKIRSGAFHEDMGEGPLNVPVGGYIIYQGGYWREYIY